MFRMMEITDRAVILSLTGPCLEVTQKDGALLERVPLEELDALVLTQPALSLTGAVLAELGRCRVAVICCDTTYIPTACMQPMFVGAAAHRQYMEAQFSLTRPRQKRLWQSIVKAKIAGQAAILTQFRNATALHTMSDKVRSGDAGNLESRAAVIYWKTLALFPARRREAEDANRLFNYVYAILYAATARYICVAGLHPHLGVHHVNPHNPFCLASDLMEPFRPAADACVIATLAECQGDSNLTSRTRLALCQTLYAQQVAFQGKPCPIFEALRLTILSYRKCLTEKNANLLKLPEYTTPTPTAKKPQTHTAVPQEKNHVDSCLF